MPRFFLPAIAQSLALNALGVEPWRGNAQNPRVSRTGSSRGLRQRCHSGFITAAGGILDARIAGTIVAKSATIVSPTATITKVSGFPV